MGVEHTNTLRYKMKYKVLLLVFLLLFMSIVSAIPKIEPYVNDYANLLSQEEEIQLNILSDSIERNTSYEIAFVTLTNTEGLDRLEYANRIGDENGVGKLDKDNGIVVLWSLDNEHGGAIATGRGSESIFNDAKVARIGRNNVNLCEDGKVYDCFRNITLQLQEEITIMNSTNSSAINSEDEPNDVKDVTILFFIIVVVGIIFVIVSNSDSSNITTFTGSRGSSSSSSGGFSGGSFGGGGGKF